MNHQLCLLVPPIPGASSRSKGAAGDCYATESLLREQPNITYFTYTVSKATVLGFSRPPQACESLAVRLIYWTAEDRGLI
jgi:hypothetical protein